MDSSRRSSLPVPLVNLLNKLLTVQVQEQHQTRKFTSPSNKLNDERVRCFTLHPPTLPFQPPTLPLANLQVNTALKGSMLQVLSQQPVSSQSRWRSRFLLNARSKNSSSPNLSFLPPFVFFFPSLHLWRIPTRRTSYQPPKLCTLRVSPSCLQSRNVRRARPSRDRRRRRAPSSRVHRRPPKEESLPSNRTDQHLLRSQQPRFEHGSLSFPEERTSRRRRRRSQLGLGRREGGRRGISSLERFVLQKLGHLSLRRQLFILGYQPRTPRFPRQERSLLPFPSALLVRLQLRSHPRRRDPFLHRSSQQDHPQLRSSLLGQASRSSTGSGSAAVRFSPQSKSRGAPAEDRHVGMARSRGIEDQGFAGGRFSMEGSRRVDSFHG